jgi:hypothetical protein
MAVVFPDACGRRSPVTRMPSVSAAETYMMEWIHITAQYSNAVLVAILPHISEFARKVELPCARPITLEQVAQFRCWPLRDDVGGAVILTNGICLWFTHGYVNGFRTPRSYYNLQDAREIQRFFGPLNLDRGEALQLARDAVRKTGYTLKESFTDQETEVEMPPRNGTNIVPHYRFKWKDPVFGRTAVSIEVDGRQKAIQEMRLASQFFWRAPPRVAVQPRLRAPRRPVSLASSNEFLSVMLPKISEFAHGVRAPFELPLSPDQVERVEFVNQDSDVRVKLTNGYWFSSKRRSVTGFNAPDTVYGRQPAALDPFPRPINEYLGAWKLSQKEAIQLVHQAIRNLGFSIKALRADREPVVTKPERVGEYIVPRFYFNWLTNDEITGGTISMVRAEVDADKGQVKYLEVIAPRVLPDANRPVKRPGLPTNVMRFRTNAPQELPQNYDLSEIIRFLDRAMPIVTNHIQKPAPTVKPPNPYE